MIAAGSATLVVTLKANARERATIADAFSGAGDIVYIADVPSAARADVLRHAGAVLARNTVCELEPRETNLIRGARLLQFLTAGIDYIPLDDLPPDLPIATNGGAFAAPMAEHALALTLAAAKRLLIEHRNLQRGEFNQFTPNRMLAGAVCGIFGCGGIGTATARLMRGLGMRIHAINRRGRTDEAVDWIGTPDRLDALLAASDVLVISAPLTRATRRAIDAGRLALMKQDAILVNLARGEIIDERALYQHLRANLRFTACLDAWWVEPIRHGEFRLDYHFLELPNVIGSPHNSAAVPGSHEAGLRRAVENCRRAVTGERPLHLIGADERLA